MRFYVSNRGRGHNLSVPFPALELSRLVDETLLEYHPLQGAVVVLSANMTALELLRASEALNELASSLLTELAEACGPCEDCGQDGECDAMRADGAPRIRVPAWALHGAGIPEDAKLACDTEEGSGAIHVFRADYEHDLSDVPPLILDAFRDAGVCMAELEEMLMEGDVVHGH